MLTLASQPSASSAAAASGERQRRIARAGLRTRLAVLWRAAAAPRFVSCNAHSHVRSLFTVAG